MDQKLEAIQQAESQDQQQQSTDDELAALFPELEAGEEEDDNAEPEAEAEDSTEEAAAEVVEDVEPEPTAVEKRLAALEERNAALLAEVERLNKSSEESTEPEAEQRPALVSYEFIKSDEEFEEISDRQRMNDLLTKVVHTTREAVLRDIPSVVSNQVNQMTAYQKLANDFYADNSDILEFNLAKDEQTRNAQIIKRKGMISLELTDIQQKNSKLPLKEAIKQAADNVRLALGITDEDRKRLKERKGKTQQKSTPAFAQPGSTRPAQKPTKGTKPEDDLEAEVDAVLAAGEGFRV